MKKKWMTSEIDYLKDNYTAVGPITCANHLGRTTGSVKKRACRLGLSGKREAFSDDQIEYIRERYAQDGPKKIGRYLGRKWSSIYSKAQSLGLSVAFETRCKMSTESNTGRVMSESSKKKIGDANRKYDNQPVCIDCGKVVRKRSQERCYKCNLDTRRGENHNWYTNGTTSLNQAAYKAIWKSWKQPILERDNYTCTECGCTSDLEVHHIERFSEIRDMVLKLHPSLSPQVIEEKQALCELIVSAHESVEGVTLCRACHRSLHFDNGVNCLGTPVNQDNQQRSLSGMEGTFND